MLIAHVQLAAMPGSPYSQSRYHGMDENSNESKDQYEQRTWRERMTVDPETGEVMIPPMALKKSLDAAASRRGEKVPGKGRREFAKYFLSGIQVYEPVRLGIRKEEVTGERLFVPSDGVKGGSKRVARTFPKIVGWRGTAEYTILATDVITKDVFVRHLADAGLYIGVGRFRPERGGFYGRYHSLGIEWREEAGIGVLDEGTESQEVPVN